MTHWSENFAAKLLNYRQIFNANYTNPTLAICDQKTQATLGNNFVSKKNYFLTPTLTKQEAFAGGYSSFRPDKTFKPVERFCSSFCRVSVPDHQIFSKAERQEKKPSKTLAQTSRQESLVLIEKCQPFFQLATSQFKRQHVETFPSKLNCCWIFWEKKIKYRRMCIWRTAFAERNLDLKDSRRNTPETLFFVFLKNIFIRKQLQICYT